MKKRMVIAVLLIAAGSSVQSQTLPTSAPILTDTPGRQSAAIVTAVFRVLCEKADSGGTAFLHRSGRLITAAHVIHNCVASDLAIIDGSGGKHTVATLVTDDLRDLALLSPATPIPGKPLLLSQKPSINLGSLVTAWGFPAGYTGLRPLLSVGYLAGDQLVASGDKFVPRWVVNGAFNAGNSGGPLLDGETSEVIGVVSSKLAPIPPEIESALTALRANKLGMQYERHLPDGTTQPISEGQVIAEVLQYLRSQVQLVIGHAVKYGDINDFLKRQKVEP